MLCVGDLSLPTGRAMRSVRSTDHRSPGSTHGVNLANYVSYYETCAGSENGKFTVEYSKFAAVGLPDTIGGV